MTLHRYLTRLIVVCMVPPLLVLIGLTSFHLLEMREDQAEDTRRFAQNAVLVLDVYLQNLPRSTEPVPPPSLTPQDLAALRSLFERTPMPGYWSIAVQDETGKVLLSVSDVDRDGITGQMGLHRITVQSRMAPWTLAVDSLDPRNRHPFIKVGAAWLLAGIMAALLALVGGKMASRKLAKSVSLLTVDGDPSLEGIPIEEIAAARRRLSALQQQRDIADAAQRSSEQRFRAAFEQSAVGIGMLALSGHWMRVNRKLADIVGYTQDEVQKLQIQDLLHPQDMQPCMSRVWQLVAREITTFTFKARHLRKNGSVVWVNLSCSLALRPDQSADYFIVLLEDIDQQILAQERQIVSKLALQSVTQGVLITDAKGHVEWGNGAFTIITGYASSEYLGRHHSFVNGPLTDPQTIDALHEALGSARSFNGDILQYRKDAAAFWNELSVSPVFDAAGNLAHFVHIVRDVTQRTLQWQEQGQLWKGELRKHELARAHLQQALSSAGVGSYEWNLGTGEQIWTDPLYTLYGVANQGGQTLQTWLNTMHPDDRAPVRQALDAAVKKNAEVVVEWRVQGSAPQSPRWLFSRAHPLPDEHGQITRYLGITIDISERKRAEMALARYRDQLEERVAERTFELLQSGAEQRRLNRALRLRSACNIALVQAEDEAGLFLKLCRVMVEIGGYAAAWVGLAGHDAEKSVRRVASFAQRADLELDFYSCWNEQHVRGQGPMGRAIRTGCAQTEQNLGSNPVMAPWADLIHAYGVQSCMVLPLSVEVAEEGGYMAALAIYSDQAFAFGTEESELLQDVGRDIVFGLEALRNRAELHAHKQQLEARVRARTNEIDTLNVQLREQAQVAQAASAAKSAFLATMSHELRTPLNAVVGLTRLLGESHLGRRQRDYADKIQLSAQALRTLIDDILDFSRIEAGELVLEHTEFSLSAVLHATASVMGVAVSGKPIEALIDVDPTAPDRLRGDPMRLQQILLNLTSNAVKFTESGAVVVAVHCQSSDAEAVSLRFEVSDTGIGIAPEKQAVIFQGFTQADSSTSRVYGGSGLGLAISARLVDLMGSSIKLRSVPGEGSVFSFELTLKRASQAQPGYASSQVPAALQVLVVEDNAQARAILANACAGLGWSACTVGSGEEALAELQRNAREDLEYDLMLLDWRMPGLDGIETLRRAHATEGIGLPLVVLMASIAEMEAAVAAADDVYLDGMLAKPITPASLFEAVRRAYTGDFVTSLPGSKLSDSRLRGMRFMVVEDNPLNQEVLQQILTRSGASVVLAGNGQVAVDLLRADHVPWDAVLMDIQMPVMDGYTATRIIRDELGLKDLPIIAVSAFAQRTDKEQALQAGMVGYVTKPLNVEDLLDLLAKERQPSGPVSEPTPVFTPASDPAPDAVRRPSMPELPGLEVGEALRAFSNDALVYRNLLRKFIATHGADVDLVRSLFDAQDLKGAQSLLHSLAGMAAVLQARDLSEHARAAEQALRDANLELMPQHIAALSQAMQTVQGSVARFEVMTL